MRKILLPLLIVAGLSSIAHAEVWRGQYGVAKTFNFKLYNADGTLDTDEADGGTEVSLSCDQGAETTATNDFVDEGTFYSIALTAAEMRCRNIAVVIAATTTEVFFIQTDGSPGVTTSGLAQSATGTTIVLASDTNFADDILNCQTVAITGGTGAGQSRPILDWVSSTDTATVPTWTTNPSSDSTYEVHQTACASFSAGSITSSSFASGAITADAIATDAIGAAEIAANAIGSSEIASDAITAAKVASDVTTELQSGLATASALSTVAGYIDTEVAAILADTNELQTDWANGGRLDLLLDGASSAGDPWTTTLPGSYTSGQAGYIIGTNVNATISSRASQTSVDDLPTNAELATALGTADDAVLAAIDDVPTAAENAAAVLTAQQSIWGTCDSGSTTTCVDDALTHDDNDLLEDRLICFDDGWCGLITAFSPGSDQVTTTKVAPSTRASKAYTIFPSTLE